MQGLERHGPARPSWPTRLRRFTPGAIMPCFSHPAQDEIEIAGRKIVGQRPETDGRAFLQHGSIPLGHDEKLLKSVSLLREDGGSG